MINGLPRILAIRVRGRDTVFIFDNLIVDILGMALVVLCLIGLVPSRRPSRRYISDF
jgi:hypothetical protein